MKMWLKKWWKPLALLLVLAGFLLHPPLVLTELRVDFEKEDYTAGHHCKIFASPTENLGVNSVKNADRKTGEARFFFWDIRWRDGKTLKRLDPIDYNLDDEIRIKDIAFFINGFYAGELSGERLFASFTPNEQVEMYETDTGSLGLYITGEDSQLLTTETFRSFYREIAGRYAHTGIFYLLPLLLALWAAAEFYMRQIWKKRGERFFLVVDTLFYLAGLAALALILTGAFVGSDMVNPDESEAVYSVQYYITHWKIPDARELEMAAYSVFGTARLTELNLFYILAAQIARLFTFEHAVRLFSVLMAAGLFYLIFCNLKKNRWLLAVMFLTPQIWYLYTYCTSDAMDYAVGALVLYQVARPDSMLQKLCSRGVKKADWWRILLLGFLFSNIFMAKQNFYVFAIYVFCMLLVDLFTAPVEERKKRFISYLWVAGFALMFLGIRYIPELLHYGIHRHRVLVELQEQIAIPKLNPASPPSEQSSAFNLYGKGVTLSELLFHMGLHKTTFRSFVGTYGSLQFPSPDWYVLLMGGLYVIYLVGCCGAVIREKGHGERKVKLGLLFFSAFVSYGLLVYNAWFIDYQAQGRYMVPVLIFAAHAAALKPEVSQKKWFQLVLAATALLSLYSFAFYCIPNIRPPY
ncbi:hypothetical protein ACTNCH_00225 [Candidatus Merdisoma sp. HCP28S3_D10]|uniref:hypothetical protein n=1 Tax=unclassified Candidatus Merdisoma TaxID=3099611 RepID=UPI003F8C718A